MRKLAVLIAAMFALTACRLPWNTPIEDYGTTEATTESEEETAATTASESESETATSTSEQVTTTTTDTAFDFVSDEAEAMYNLLMANTDIIRADGAREVLLIDLDFDGAPEVVVYNNGETDIYRATPDGLKYIGTLHIYTNYYDGNGIDNVLPLVNENGEKKWLVSCDDQSEFSDRLVELCGDELVFTDIFTVSGESTYVGDGFYTDNRDYRFKGEKIEFEEYETENPYENDGSYMTAVKWGEYGSIFGKFFIIDRARVDYFKDIVSQAVTLGNKTAEMSDGEFGGYIAEIANNFSSYGNESVLREYSVYMIGAYGKPVIYLYPTEPLDVSVRVKFPKGGGFTCTYPDYNSGWNVTAYPDGRIINKADGYEYSYLYWEGEGFPKWDFSRGFVVAGKDTAEFLREKLSYMGLTPREYNEFIVYWLPLMQNNAYNLIAFQTGAYTDSAVLEITPKPDSMLRVFMAYMPLDEVVAIEEQELARFERTGFCVVEWGGTTVN